MEWRMLNNALRVSASQVGFVDIVEDRTATFADNAEATDEEIAAALFAIGAAGTLFREWHRVHQAFASTVYSRILSAPLRRAVAAWRCERWR